MSEPAGFNFRFETLFRKFKRDVKVAEGELAGHCAQLERTRDQIENWKQSNQRLEKSWTESIRAGSATSIDSRLVFSRLRNELMELQTQLQADTEAVQRSQTELQSVSQRLRSIELIRESDLEMFKREQNRKHERDALQMILRKTGFNNRASERSR